MRFERLLVLSMVGLVGCGGEGASDMADEAMSDGPVIREAHYVATDFAFSGPTEIEEGLITFVLESPGEIWHHMQLVRLPEGTSFEAFQTAVMETPETALIGIDEAGGVNPPPPGGPARATIALTAGEYAVICLVDVPDHVPHALKGMMAPLTVTPSEEPMGTLPETEISLQLTDFAFGFSQPLTAGTHTIRVGNIGQQSHEIAVFRLNPGVALEDVFAWAMTFDGPPPMVAVGGVPGIEPGVETNIELDLMAGDYVALCFLPDENGGGIHAELGMVLPFTVS